MENYETKGLLFLIDETSYRKSFMVYACENAYLWIYLSSRVETPKNEEEASRTPSPHEILSSLASSPRPTTFGNKLGSAERV